MGGSARLRANSSLRRIVHLIATSVLLAANGEEAAAFVTLRYANDAVSLRLWNDEAKQAGLDVPGLDAYIPYLQRRLMGGAARP